ncbi:MAG TPA: VWA domain-containing protein [Pyrinomonadaceae bacterium]|nr:VWA domain-containing protein [Pyrinomonadaceae bacterium]
MRFFGALIRAALCLALTLASAAAQTRAKTQRSGPPQKPNAQPASTPKPTPAPAPTPTPTPEPAEEGTSADDLWADGQDDSEVERVETDLVTVPVVVSDRNNVYVPDMRQEEFAVFENGFKQDLVFFASASAPFNVVLMLDTSASTQEKIGLIQRAAVAFVEQLQPGDKVKVISFDDKVRTLSDFTNDRAALAAAVRRTQPGKGTKLYDAMALALGSLRRVEGRRAIVIFTDGVDWHSERAEHEGTLRMLEESGVIVYPIRFDTRAETEALARRQAREGQRPEIPTVTGTGGSTRPTTPTTLPGGEGVPLPEDINSGRRGGGGPRGSTPTTVPGGQIPFPGGSSGGGPLGGVVVERRRDDVDDRRRRPNDPDMRRPGDQWPDEGDTNRGADARYPGQRRNDPRNAPRDIEYDDDAIARMLKLAYSKADSYLEDLAEKSGGSLYRADTLASLPDAFARIAAELRAQYSLGYYPTNRMRDGRFRKIQVKTTRKNVALRARPGYRARKQ